MICRLHYKKVSGILVSEKVETPKGALYIAKISFSEGWWKIFNAKRRNCIKKGFSKNKNSLRRAVRCELINLGVKLENESGRKGFAVTRKA